MPYIKHQAGDRIVSESRGIEFAFSVVEVTDKHIFLQQRINKYSDKVQERVWTDGLSNQYMEYIGFDGQNHSYHLKERRGEKQISYYPDGFFDGTVDWDKVKRR